MLTSRLEPSDLSAHLSALPVPRCATTVLASVLDQSLKDCAPPRIRGLGFTALILISMPGLQTRPIPAKVTLVPGVLDVGTLDLVQIWPWLSALSNAYLNAVDFFTLPDACHLKCTPEQMHCNACPLKCTPEQLHYTACHLT